MNLTRRFWCDAVLCGRRIFCGRFDGAILARYGRRTQRLETIVHHLGLALGGRPAAGFAHRLIIPVSKDTLLRVVRRRVSEQDGELSVIGIDDFAFRRGQTYGTIVCDLERRRPVALLPDRALNTSRNWLAERPSISIVARDRGGGYGEAIVRALPDAAQVADRWHLMENSSRAFLDAVSKSMQSPKTKEFLMMLLDADAGYLTLINTFTVEPEKADYLVAALSATTKTFLVGKPGFISANLHVSLDGKHVANYAQWRSKEDMDAAMLDPAIQAGIREAVGFATGFAPILYRLAETHTAQS